MQQTTTPAELFALLDPSKLFFFRKELSVDDVNALACMFAQPGDLQARVKNVHFLLLLMHDAMRVDQRRYLSTVFLPWTGLKQRTRLNKDAINDEFSRVGDPSHPFYARRLVGIYRSIVAELFDPYLTLATATLQFLENRFKRIEHANVAWSERTKAEYVHARDGFSDLLRGYEPLVRNAASHAGSDGVKYRNGLVEFRDVSRSDNYKVKRIDWTVDELENRVVLLYECIISFDLAENVFGLDCAEFIVNDVPTRLQYLHERSTLEQRSNMRSAMIGEIRRRAGEHPNADSMLTAYMSDMVSSYADRDMTFASARQSKPGLLTIEVPIGKYVEMSEEDEVADRISNLLRYGIVAVAGLEKAFSTIEVVEVSSDVPSRTRLRVSCSSDLLCEYAEERAGLVDLLAACVATMDGFVITSAVDYDKVADAESQVLSDPFPRKGRPAVGSEDGQPEGAPSNGPPA